MNLFKDRLAFLMDQFNLSQVELAERSGVSRSSIGHMLNGRNQPSMDFLAGVLQEWPEIDADWLVMGKGPWRRKNQEASVPAKPSKEHKQQQTPVDLFGAVPLSGQPSEPVSATLSDSEDKEAYISAGQDIKGPLPAADDAFRADAQELLVLYPDGTYRRFLPRD